MVKKKEKAKKPKKAEKKEEESENEEPEEEETTEDPDAPTNPYAEGDNPGWITEPPAVTIESPKGRRLHVYSEEKDPQNSKKNRVLVTGKDWEDKNGLHPGKVISMPAKEFNALVVGYLKEVYQYEFELDEGEEPEE